MELTVTIVRWAGLGVALLLTLVVLKEVALVLRTLSDIRALSERIRDASRGTARNVEPAEGAAAMAPAVRRFREAGRRYAAAAGVLADHLHDVSQVAEGSGPSA